MRQAGFAGSGRHGNEKLRLRLVEGSLDLLNRLFLVIPKPKVVHGFLGQFRLGSRNVLLEKRLSSSAEYHP